MKIRTVESIFKVALAIIAVFGVYLIVIGTGRIIHGEADPLKGSLRVLFQNYLTLVILAGVGIIVGIGSLILGGAKPK